MLMYKQIKIKFVFIHIYFACYWSYTNKFDTSPIMCELCIEFEHIHTQVNKVAHGVFQFSQLERSRLDIFLNN